MKQLFNAAILNRHTEWYTLNNYEQMKRSQASVSKNAKNLSSQDEDQDEDDQDGGGKESDEEKQEEEEEKEVKKYDKPGKRLTRTAKRCQQRKDITGKKNIRTINERNQEINQKLPDAWDGISQRLLKKLGPRQSYIQQGHEEEDFRLLKREEKYIAKKKLRKGKKQMDIQNDMSKVQLRDAIEEPNSFLNFMDISDPIKFRGHYDSMYQDRNYTKQNDGIKLERLDSVKMENLTHNCSMSSVMTRSRSKRFNQGTLSFTRVQDNQTQEEGYDDDDVEDIGEQTFRQYSSRNNEQNRNNNLDIINHIQRVDDDDENAIIQNEEELKMIFPDEEHKENPINQSYESMLFENNQSSELQKDHTLNMTMNSDMLQGTAKQQSSSRSVSRVGSFMKNKLPKLQLGNNSMNLSFDTTPGHDTPFPMMKEQYHGIRTPLLQYLSHPPVVQKRQRIDDQPFKREIKESESSPFKRKKPPAIRIETPLPGGGSRNMLGFNFNTNASVSLRDDEQIRTPCDNFGQKAMKLADWDQTQRKRQAVPKRNSFLHNKDLDTPQTANLFRKTDKNDKFMFKHDELLLGGDRGNFLMREDDRNPSHQRENYQSND